MPRTRAPTPHVHDGVSQRHARFQNVTSWRRKFHDDEKNQTRGNEADDASAENNKNNVPRVDSGIAALPPPVLLRGSQQNQELPQEPKEAPSTDFVFNPKEDPEIALNETAFAAADGSGGRAREKDISSNTPSKEEDFADAGFSEQALKKPDLQDFDYGARKTKLIRLVLGGFVAIVLIVAIIIAVVLSRSSEGGGNNENQSSLSNNTGTDAPGTDIPEIPDTIEPATETPVTAEPATETPVTAEPGSDSPGTIIPSTDMPSSPQGFSIPNTLSSIDENFLTLAVTAVRLCVDVNQNNTEELQPTALVFTDEPDKSMVVQVENVCFGVFRATSNRVDDWLQSFDQRIARNVCSNLTGECCRAYRGFRNGYTTSFRQDFEDALNQCKEDCPDCEVLLTGTSQGAGIAHVAGVFLDHLDPAILVFGQPLTMEEPCDAIEKSRMFRFINTIIRNDQLLYDPVPFLVTVLGNPVHMGHLFVLGESLQDLAYYEDGEAPDIGYGDIAVRFTAAAHLLVHYRARLETLFNMSTLPISIDGFGIGQKCTRGSECVAPHICAMRVCSKGEAGDACKRSEDCTSGSCSEGQCIEGGDPEMSTFFVPSSVTELDKDLFSLSLSAAEFSVALAANNTEELLPDALVFIDEPDEALVIQQNNTCFAVFRGTTPRFDDWAQNLNPNTAEDVCEPSTGKCCTTRAGFRNAYVNTTYRQQLEDAVYQCVQDCPKCEVIFSGPSQGGAVALVAAIFMSDLSPAIITHGQPPAVEAPCTAIDTSRYYRFINTVVRNGDLRFDPVPFLNDIFGNTDDFGHMIILGEDLENVAYYPDGGEYPPIGFGDFAIQALLEAHLPFRYRDRLLGIATNGTFPLSIVGWGITQKCSEGSQCVSPNICGDGQCTNGMVGEPCRADDQCRSGNCVRRVCEAQE